jgi:hypothetical protein
MSRTSDVSVDSTSVRAGWGRRDRVRPELGKHLRCSTWLGESSETVPPASPVLFVRPPDAQR